MSLGVEEPTSHNGDGGPRLADLEFVHSETKRRKVSWSLPACGALGAIILLLPTLIWGNDAAAFSFSIPLAVVIGVILVAAGLTKLRRHTLEVAAMICIFPALVFFLYRSADYLRTTTRWLIFSQNFKKRVLEQQKPANGNLRHVEWDGWGFAGAGNTTVYLVNDPDDRLEEAAKTGSPGKFSGIPCEAVRIRRLERYWYMVLFYTDTDWNDCAP